MNEIRYRIFGDTALLASVVEGGDGVRIVTEPQITGFIRLGERTYRMESGSAEISDIADGEHTPMLITARAQIRLPAISIKDGRVMAAKVSDSDLRQMMLGVFELGERVAELESAVERIDGMINRKIRF